MSLIIIPAEEINIDDKKKFWTPKRIARMSIFIAISAVGSMIKVPSPTGTVALDASIAYFSAIAFGWREGSIVAILGHILTALTTGFPLSFPLHIFIAFQMAAWVSLFAVIAKKIHLWAGIIVGVFLNGPVSSLLVVPVGGFGLMAALILPLTIGSAINIFVAVTAYLIINKSKII
ncbi:MAG: alpha-ribazole transporter [Ignavibacteriae bacterium HGW-Ignavibacteriae-2]|jgi:uncharacterized membrane protein|nr:MAG: alpha-ribazole transporter [Ignavibacteriae bacterium HGW-Ignavibacteriae-2]